MESIAYLFTATFLRYILIAGTAFSLFYLLFANKVFNNRIQKRDVKKNKIIKEILHSSKTSIVFAFIAFVIFYTPLKNYTVLYDNINEYPIYWVITSLLLSLIIHDTYFYWMHRLLHIGSIYRVTHKLHHQSVSPTPWTSYSFSTLEAISEGLILILIVFIIPLHYTTVILFTIVSLIINVYGHLGYEVAPKFFRNTIFFEIFNTSVHHNLHHSKFHGNYSLYFRFWDRIMKTENPEYVKEYDKIQKKRFYKDGQ